MVVVRGEGWGGGARVLGRKNMLILFVSRGTDTIYGMIHNCYVFFECTKQCSRSIYWIILFRLADF